MKKPKFRSVKLLSANQFLLFTCTVIMLSIPFSSGAEAISDTPNGQKTVVKFMESLARYVTWPGSSFDGADSPYKYCLMGEAAISGLLSEKLGAKKVKKRGFEIKQLALDDIEQGKSCHLVFIAATDVPTLRNTISALSDSAVLTTGDFKQFAGHGGMVGFVGVGGKGSLQINKKRLEASGLKASSKLYRVSTL